jgi:hypothetical protein
VDLAVPAPTGASIPAATDRPPRQFPAISTPALSLAMRSRDDDPANHRPQQPNQRPPLDRGKQSNFSDKREPCRAWWPARRGHTEALGKRRRVARIAAGRSQAYNAPLTSGKRNDLSEHLVRGGPRLDSEWLSLSLRLRMAPVNRFFRAAAGGGRTAFRRAASRWLAGRVLGGGAGAIARPVCRAIAREPVQGEHLRHGARSDPAGGVMRVQVGNRPNQDSTQIQNRCDPYSPDLSRLFRAPEAS